MFSIHAFKDMSPSDAKGVLAGLDKAALVPLYEKVALDPKLDNKILGYNDDGRLFVDGSMKQTPKVYGLKNLNTGTVHFGAAKNYMPLNHEDALDPVLTAADHLGLNTLINIDNHHDVVEAFILFPDLMVNDHQDGIQMGVRFKNQYNDKKSFKGSAFGWRLACANGMLATKTFGELVITAWHTEKQVLGIPAKVEEFIDGILQRSHLLEVQIDNAIAAKVSFKDYAEIANTLAPITESKKIADVAALQIDNPEKTNKWELYNAITAYASHEQISHIKREALIGNAEAKILHGTVIPIPVPVVA